MELAQLPAGAAGWHLAQLNVAIPRAPVDDPLMREFMSLLAPINALADQSVGFVWRLQTEAGDATAIRGIDDDRFMLNLSVWEDLESLWNFTYASRHLDVVRRRREWFERHVDVYLVLWWIGAGTLPSVEDAENRLGHLRRHGPGPEAFTFKVPFAPVAPGPGLRPAAAEG
jgi:hypothetical protein